MNTIPLTFGQLTFGKTTTAVLLICLTSGCAKEVPPRSVSEFIEDPILLEATMVRCAQNRDKTKYDVECVNAREAGNRLDANHTKDRRKEFEAQSERKRKALRRTQEAAAEARRRAAEAQRQREEDEYLGVFETPLEGSADNVPPTGTLVDTNLDTGAEMLQGNQPGAAISPPESDESVDSEDDSNEPPSDIEAVRDELRHRQDSSG